MIDVTMFTTLELNMNYILLQIYPVPLVQFVPPNFPSSFIDISANTQMTVVILKM